MPITLDVSLFSTTWVNEASPSDIIQRKNKELLPEPTAAVTVSKEKRISTMRDAVSTFFLGDYHGPGMVAMAISGLLLWRGCLGCSSSMGFYADDVAAALGAVSFWCFQEHWMHRYLLHSDMDWYGKQIHEQHHLKPYHHISIDPAPLMISWLTAVHFLLRVFLPLPLAVSATIGYAVAGLFYEWSHFIVHTKVRFPSNSYWQRMKDHHIRHHLVDCENWFAFSCIQVDDLFGTNPSVQEQKQAKRLNDTILVEPKVHPHRIVPL